MPRALETRAWRIARRTAPGDKERQGRVYAGVMMQAGYRKEGKHWVKADKAGKHGK